RTFHRSLKELRRLQAGNLEPAVLMLEQAKALDVHLKDAHLKKELDQYERQLSGNVSENFTKRTQSAPVKTAAVPRGAPCPCKSGQKYKRCCGKSAPPVLTAPRAA